MKHYKSPTGTIWAYESDGSQDHLIPSNFVLASLADMGSIMPPTLTPAQITIQGILQLENTITSRRLRDGLLTDSGRLWLEDVEAKITALRATLTAN